MKPIDSHEISNFSRSDLKALAIEQSQLLAVATRMIRNLEKQVDHLAQAVGEKNQKLLFSAEALQRMRHMQFGKSSEKRDEGDHSPLFGTDGASEEDNSAVVENPKPKDPRPPKKHPGRRRQQSLDIQDVNHTYNQVDCEQNGLSPWEGQFEVSELITVVPSRIILQRHKRQKYFRWNPETGNHDIITAPGPLRLKEGSRYSIELATELGLAKYQWHLPMDRQCQMLAEHGLAISPQTIWDQIDTVAFYLQPTVFKGIIEKIEQTRVNLADDTHWPNLESSKTRERDNFYLWAVTNPNATCFNVFDARSQKVASTFLGNLRGVLVTDGHASFKKLGSENLALANDWYHFRRKVKAAEDVYPEECSFILDRIAQLSQIESRIQGRPPNEVFDERQKSSRPLVGELRTFLDGLSHVLPRSGLGRAVTYANRLWTGLTVFLDQPDVPMHTNDVERAIRGPAVGRKNHYGSKNLESARVAAVWYSVVATCKQNGISPREYIVDTLKAILTRKPVLMPWEWQPAGLMENVLGTD
jgi:transposase